MESPFIDEETKFKIIGNRKFISFPIPCKHRPKKEKIKTANAGRLIQLAHGVADWQETETYKRTIVVIVVVHPNQFQGWVNCFVLQLVRQSLLTHAYCYVVKKNLIQTLAKVFP